MISTGKKKSIYWRSLGHREIDTEVHLSSDKTKRQVPAHTKQKTVRTTLVISIFYAIELMKSALSRF